MAQKADVIRFEGFRRAWMMGTESEIKIPVTQPL